MANGPTAAQLLRDAAWLKRLALRLAADPDEADDVVQESWIAAWRSTLDLGRPLRPWLTKVARDVAGMRRRAERRRTAREAAVEEPHPIATPDQLLETVRLHRMLAELVLELDEPYRSTIVARFVDDRSAAEIARSLGVAESTIRGRLRDGLARLRARLDERYGLSRAWAPTVLALGRRGASATRPTRAVGLIAAVLALLLSAAMITRIPQRHPSGGASARPIATGVQSAVASEGAKMLPLDSIVAGRPPGGIAPPDPSMRRVAGRVFVDGVAVAGAAIRLTSRLSQVGLAPPIEGRTGPDGAFDFGPQPRRELTVSATVPGKLAAIADVDLRDPLARPDALELAVTSCVASLYGHVLDAAGGPVANAQVLREDAIGTTSDASGAYDLCVPSSVARPEQLLLVVRAAGYGGISMVAAPSGRVRHDFLLTPEALIDGAAAGEDGLPVADAAIWAEPDDSGSRPAETPARAVATSDSHGRFRLSGLAGGRHRVTGVAKGKTAVPALITVAPGESRQIALRMRSTGVIRGRVVRGDDLVAGAHVAVADAGLASAVSQADGSFVLDGVPAGEHKLTADPYRVLSPMVVQVVAGDNDTIVVSVEQLGQLHGVVSYRGAPVVGARVRVYGPTEVAVTSDARGHFDVAGLDPGSYVVSADDGGVRAYAESTKLDLDRGDTRSLDIELLPGGDIIGMVVDTAGVPVVGAEVRVHDEHRHQGRCTTDAAGAFDCGELAAGSYEAAVFPSMSGLIAFRFAAAPPAPIELAGRGARAEVQLVVEADRQSIGGVVADLAGAPVPDARVQIASSVAEPGAASLWMAPPSGVTGVDGTFRIDDLAPGGYRLRVVSRDGATTALVIVPAGTSDARLVVVPPCGDGDAVMHREPPDIQHRPPARIVWNSEIELVGWSQPAAVRAGEDFELVFYYRVLQPTDRSWRIFVHLDGEGRRLNVDHEPLGGRCPVSQWAAGQYLVDRFTARFDASGFRAGTYTLWTGFFTGWADRWVNMPVSDAPPQARDAGDRVAVGSIALRAKADP